MNYREAFNTIKQAKAFCRDHFNGFNLQAVYHPQEHHCATVTWGGRAKSTHVCIIKALPKLYQAQSQMHAQQAQVGGSELKYLSSAPFFPIFGLTAVLKILSFRALVLGDNIADLLQCWHQQPVLQIVTRAHSPACNSGSSAEMPCQSHWKTQIEGLTKR